MDYPRRAWSYIYSLPRLYSIGGGIVIIAAVAVGAHLLMRSAPPPEAPEAVPHVSLASAAELSSKAGPLSVVGKVSSLNQANILAQTSGELVSLTRSIGSSVGAGEVIGQFENSSQRAAVLQAQGAYDAAAASRQSTSLPEAETQARNSYSSAYTTLDTTLHADIDLFFGSPTPYGPALLINSASGDTKGLSRERQDIEDTMDGWRRDLADASTSDPGALLDTAFSTAQEISSFVTELARSANEQGSRATADQLTALASARTKVDGVLASLSSARDTYRSKSVGATSLSDASIEQAQGALDAAKATLEKTIVRSPISGTIVSLPVNQGDFITQGTQVAAVSNPSALEVDAYVTPDDAKTLSVSAPVAIDSATKGVIVSIAPALDPTTNKILVKIGITGDQSALTDGETVTVALTRSTATNAAKTSAAITIPIKAVKILPDGPIVFTVSSSTLASAPVTLGTILGDQVTIASGLSADTRIVTDARGLSEGETVVVDN